MENLLYILSENLTQIVIPLIISFTITLFFIPQIIKFSKNRNLFDKPNSRKIHKNLISRFGGVGIFIGFIIPLFLFIYIFNSYSFIYLLMSVSMIFSIGLIDDFKGMRAMDKFYIQIFAAFIVAYGGFRIDSLYGLFGVFDIPIGIQYIITVAVIVGVTNAYNLLDGIDGLAGGIGFINFIVISIIALYFGSIPVAIISLSMSGAILAFLIFNFNPAKIFMGDSGSLLIGFVMVNLSIYLIKINDSISLNLFVENFLIIIGSIMFLPVADTLRVFTLRIINKKSPFKADQNHLHHILLHKGFNHKKSSIILYIINILIIIGGYSLKDLTVSKNIVSVFFLFH